MSMGRIFAPRVVDNTSSKLSAPAESSFAPADDGLGESKSTDRARVDVGPVVRRRFMSMMEAHDRMRARVLGPSPTSSYTVSGD